MKFIITKEVEARSLAEAFNRHLKGEGEVVEVFKAKDQPAGEKRLVIGFKPKEHKRLKQAKK
jgi:hypothetical protein